MKTVIIAFVGGVVLGPVALLAVSQPPEPTTPDKHRQAMVEAARSAFEAVRQELEIAHTRGPEDAYVWSYRFMQSERLAGRDPLAAAQDHVDRMRALNQGIVVRAKNGIEGGEAANVHATTFYLAEARLELATVQASKTP